MYDRRNIFAQIIRGEIDIKKIYESEYALSFKDKFPKANVHVLVIPKGYYKDLTDFLINASTEMKLGYLSAINETLKILNLTQGYRIVNNCGELGGQEIPHLHFHILSGEKLGPLICK